jgi:hypothetical protein
MRFYGRAQIRPRLDARSAVFQCRGVLRREPYLPGTLLQLFRVTAGSQRPGIYRRRFAGRRCNVCHVSRPKIPVAR